MISNNSRPVEKLWICNEITKEDIEVISKEANVSPFLAKILLSRGMRDIDEIRCFLNPSLSELHDPFLIKDMKKAVDRIRHAINVNERIVIYGDYDVDGITSTSVLISFLSGISSNIDYYIPDRIDEGYGLSMGSIDKIKQQGTSLIITVDCGITAIEEVKRINDLGMDVIITDHHECKEILPEAYAIVSPCRPDSDYPFNELAGVGVVYKLIMAMCSEMGLDEMHLKYLDLVTLGTVADVVPLVDENRVIVKHGISLIEKTTNVGLKVLLENCNLKEKQVTSWTISFVLAPRINAAGRVGNAGRAVELLTTTDKDKALEIVLQLNEENRFRQETEQEIFQQVVSMIEKDIDLKNVKVLVVCGEGWHHGVIGIVASKVTEKYYRPCILISHEDGIGKGSGRSIEGFDLFKALSHCAELLNKFGGHELAAGLSLSMDNLSLFRERINKYADNIMEDEDLYPKLRIDANIDTVDVNMANIRDLELLAPYGAGNPGPVFEYDSLKINDIRTLSEGKHLKLLLENGGLCVDAIGFGMGSMIESYNKSDLIDVACTLEINSWNSIDKVQLNMRDIKPNQEVSLEDSYYYSLDKCMKFDSEKHSSESAVLQYLDNEDILIPEIINEAKNGKKVILLVNSLIGVKSIEKKLRIYTAGIKKMYTICYTNFKCSIYHCQNSIRYREQADSNSKSNKSGLEGVFENRILVVVNPNYDEIDLSSFDRVVFYGWWVNPVHLLKLVDKIDRSRLLFLKCESDRLLEVCELVPDRKDLVAVFQYIKANLQFGCVEENLFRLAKKISSSYKINMNYFKMKKSIEIFEELNLIHKLQIDENKVKISIIDNGSVKTNIEKSLLYRNLQALKTNIIG